MKKFDLNIEKILEDWQVFHAIRELIANALDEQILTKTREVEIFKSNGYWIIRDYGRGLNHSHLTQNENKEKLLNPHVIGKFGIGLKDALATFDRKGIEVKVKSKYGLITTQQSNKQGFDDIITLHAVISPPANKDILGTRIELHGVSNFDIEKAKNLFLRFSGEEILETTSSGEIVKKSNKTGNIYINGVKVAEEENFLFSYNITSLNASIRKALNRERTNVGRSAYSDSVKKILLKAKSFEIAQTLAEDLEKINKGSAHDELSWIDIQEHSVKTLNQLGKYLFLTSSEAIQFPNMVDEARNCGHVFIVIPENLKSKLKNSLDHSGNPVIDLNQFIADYNDSFSFKFIEREELNNVEQQVYDLIPEILRIFGGKPKKVKEIKISGTMRKELLTSRETLGCWDVNSKAIVVSRQQLKSVEAFSGTLIHELIHAKTGFSDVTREFESELTEYIGKICGFILNSK